MLYLFNTFLFIIAAVIFKMSVIIRLQNLPWTANALDIRRYFHGLHIPDGGVHIVGGDDGDAFIAFGSDEDARKAMLHSGEQINGMAVRLMLSSKAEMQNVIAKARGVPSEPPRVAPGYQPMGSQSYPMPPGSSGPDFRTPPPNLPPQNMPLNNFPVGPRGPPVQTRPPGPMPTFNDPRMQQPPPFVPPGMPPPNLGVPPMGGPGPWPQNPGFRPPVSGPPPQAVPPVNFPPVAGPGFNNPPPDLGNGFRNDYPPERRSRSRSPPPRRSRSRSPRRYRSRSPRPRDYRSRSRSRSRGRRSRDRYSPKRRRSSSSRREIRMESPRRRFPSYERERESRPEPPRRRSRTPEHRFERGNSRGRPSYPPAGDMEPRRRFSPIERERREPPRRESPVIVRREHSRSRTPDRFTARRPISPDIRRRSPSPRRERIPETHRSRSPPRQPTGRGRDNRGRSPEKRFEHKRKPGRDADARPSDIEEGLPHNDLYVFVKNMPVYCNYKEIKQFFQGLYVHREGIKIDNDSSGKRTGCAYLRFINEDSKREAMKMDGEYYDENRIDVLSASWEEFDKAIDSYLPPGMRKGFPYKKPDAVKSQGDNDFWMCLSTLPQRLERYEISKFFAPNRIVNGSIFIEYDHHGNVSGRAYCQFVSRRDFKGALVCRGKTLKKCKIWIEGITYDDMNEAITKHKFIQEKRRAVENPNANPRARKPSPKRRRTEARPPPIEEPIVDIKRLPSPFAEAENVITSHEGYDCVKIKGLPFQADERMVRDFFGNIDIPDNGIHMLFNSKGQALTHAFVEFRNADDCKRALKLDMEYIGKRYINVTPITHQDLYMELKEMEDELHQGEVLKYSEGDWTDDAQKYGGTVVVLANTPFKAKKNDILEFFKGFDVIEQSLCLCPGPKASGPVGNAAIALVDEREAKRAMGDLQGNPMWGRTVQLTMLWSCNFMVRNISQWLFTFCLTGQKAMLLDCYCPPVHPQAPFCSLTFNRKCPGPLAVTKKLFITSCPSPQLPLSLSCCDLVSEKYLTSWRYRNGECPHLWISARLQYLHANALEIVTVLH